MAEVDLQDSYASSSDADFEGFGEEDLVRAGVVLSKRPMTAFIPQNNVHLPADIAEGWEITDSETVNAPFRFTVFAPHEIADVCLHLIFTGVDVNYLSSRVVEILHHRGINFVDI